MVEPTVISTFAGCGGSSLGYKLAGYHELLAVEWDDNAVETFRLNFPDVPVYHGDIAKLSGDECMKLAGIGRGELDVLDGSPPCQGFSTAGKRKFDDPRNSLFKEYARLLNELQPKVFVMENVTGMVKGVMKQAYLQIIKTLRECGYRAKGQVMNAMYYNVPQSRQRVIIIGVRNDLGIEPSHPKPQTKPITVGSVLPVVGDGIMLPEKYYAVWRASPVGGSFGDGHVALGGKQESYAAKKLDPRRPSNAITKQLRLGLSGLHRWDEPRLVSAMELRRISSFPDGFKFAVGDESKRAGYSLVMERIGNSVPPNLMRAIAEHINSDILQNLRVSRV